MLNDVISQESVLQLFNLECDDAEEVRCRNVDGFMRVDIRLTPHYESCPECGCIHPVVKDYQTKKIKHSVLSDRKCILFFYSEITYGCFQVFQFKNLFADFIRPQGLKLTDDHALFHFFLSDQFHICASFTIHYDTPN